MLADCTADRAVALDGALCGDSVAALADEGPADFWTLDEVAAWQRRTAPARRRFRFPVPTYAPWDWPATPVCSQAEYSAWFASEYPTVAQILPIDGVHVVAFAAHPLRVPHLQTVQVAIVGDGADAAWPVVAEIADRLRAANGDFVLETLGPGMALFSMDSGHVRVTLCRFATLDDALRPEGSRAWAPLRVAYDGVTTRMTTAAAYSYAFRVFPIGEPQALSTSTLQFCDDARFALALLPGAGPCEALWPDVVRGRFAAGGMRVTRAPYGGDVTWLSWAVEVNPTEDPHMPSALASIWLLAAGRPGCFVTCAWGRAGGRHEGHAWRDYAERGSGPGYALSEQELEAGLAAFAQLAASPDGRVSATVLRHVYRMTDEQIGRFAGAVADVVADRPRGLDAAPALASFTAAIRAAHASAAHPVDWAGAPPPPAPVPVPVPAGPPPDCATLACATLACATLACATLACAAGRAGCDPRAAWALDDPGLLAPECRAGEHARVADEYAKALADGVEEGALCYLCRGAAFAAPGVLTFPCGHRVHWGAAGACPGYLAVGGGRPDCPAC